MRALAYCIAVLVCLDQLEGAVAGTAIHDDMLDVAIGLALHAVEGTLQLLLGIERTGYDGELYHNL